MFFNTRCIYYTVLSAQTMPRGLKPTSDMVQISSRVTESGANTYTQIEVPLTLDVLNREVFVVTGVDLNPGAPEGLAGTDTAVNACISVTSRTTMGFISDSNVIAAHQLAIRGAGYADAGVGFEASSLDTPPANMDYIGFIATNDFFLSVQGTGNNAASAASARVYGYRAQASADIFAALTQSELLSA